MNKMFDKQALTWYYVVSKERDATVSKDWRFTLYDRTVLKVRSSSESATQRIRTICCLPQC